MPGTRSVILSLMKTLHRIGIVDRTTSGWTAGLNYTKMLVHSLGNACQTADMELYLFSQNQDTDFQYSDLLAKVIPLTSSTYFRGEKYLRRLFGLPNKSSWLTAARTHQIPVLLPLTNIPVKSSHEKTIGWIPDFQHVYLPEFFSETVCRGRDVAFRLLAQRATLVMLSSQIALGHFVAFVPEYTHKARVLSFPSLHAFEPLEEDTLSSRCKFNLPEKFVLVANQFWRHKNHLVVVEAIGQLRRKGIRIPVVMTGLPADYRDPENQIFSRILQAIASAGVVDQITILGLVPYADLVNLMRTAAVVIQPSRFEGWSTIVQDAKALGRPLICSDIPVHREQAPAAIGFFPCDRADTLADLLAANWTSLEPGPCLALEKRALVAERELARHHGESLLRICQEAYSI